MKANAIPKNMRSPKGKAPEPSQSNILPDFATPAQGRNEHFTHIAVTAVA
jgi:hypothetical protein